MADAKPAIPSSVTADVLNATDVSRWAGRNATGLRTLGFKVNLVDSTGASADTVVEYPLGMEAAAKAVGVAVPGANLADIDRRPAHPGARHQYGACHRRADHCDAGEVEPLGRREDAGEILDGRQDAGPRLHQLSQQIPLSCGAHPSLMIGPVTSMGAIEPFWSVAGIRNGRPRPAAPELDPRGKHRGSGGSGGSGGGGWRRPVRLGSQVLAAGLSVLIIVTFGTYWWKYHTFNNGLHRLSIFGWRRPWPGE